MKNQNKIKKEILDKVKEFYLAKIREEFVPGETPVNYAGRIYDERELVNLVGASLDFWLTAGSNADSFEKKLAKFIGVNYCLFVNSGSSANLLAISALVSPKLGKRRLNPEDEVITTACGFPTTVNPIIQNGLIPVFADVDLGNYNASPEKIESAISEKTKAIFIPHTLGNPFNAAKIAKIAKDNNLWLIEDNCDALGSRYENKLTGSFGDISTCSFYPAHQITTGEGGAVLTDNLDLKKIITALRDWGRDCFCESGRDNTCGKRFSQQLGKLPYGYDHKYIYSHIGYNLKNSDLAAAIGLAQLEKLPSFVSARKRNFSVFFRFFSDYEKYFILPRWEKNADPCWFGFPLLVKESAPFCRAEIISHFEKNKIATRMLFGGNLTKQPAYENVKYRICGNLANTDIVMDNLFWIGVYPGIGEEKFSYIVKTAEDFLEKYEK